MTKTINIIEQYPSALRTVGNSTYTLATTAISARIAQVIAATDTGIQRVLKEGVRRAKADPVLAAGHMMEAMHTSTFNIDSTFKGTDAQAFMTADLGRPCDPVDIIVKRGNEHICVQAKNTVTDSTSRLAARTGDLKYEQCDQILVPSDKLDNLKTYSEGRLEKPSRHPNPKVTREGHQQIVDKATAQIDFKGASSKATTGQQAREYAADPSTAVRGFIKHGAVRASVLGAGAGLTAAALTAITSREEDVRQRAKQAGVAGAKAAGASIVTGAAVATITRLARQHGGTALRPLAKANVAAAVIDGITTISQESYRYWKGDSTGTEAVDKVAEKGMSMAGSFAGIALAGLALAAAPVCAPVLLATGVVTVSGMGGSTAAAMLYRKARNTFQRV